MLFRSFPEALRAAFEQFPAEPNVHTERWQAVDISNKPEAAMHEILHFNFKVPLDGVEELDFYRREIKPNLPWADNHFLERVGGEPINPGVEHANWPYAFKGKQSLDAGGQYNHNYMERMWPKYAGKTPKGTLKDRYGDGQEYSLIDAYGLSPIRGIRHEYGDLSDVVELLHEEPMTRQAYLPIWFPEDTGVTHYGRKPCTLGWRFIMRDNNLDITYDIRSCDFLRHFQDDIYMAVRLLLWVLDELRLRDKRWNDVKPGMFVMNITSLHMFRNDYVMLKRKYHQNEEGR